MFEDSEYSEPAKAFQEAGHTVVTIEKEKGKKITGKNKEVEVTIDESIDSVDPSDYDALFIPGGFSPDQLRADDRFVQFVKAFMDEKNPFLLFAMVHNCSLRQNHLMAEMQQVIHQSKWI